MDADMMANDVFDLAARQASWLLARQQVVAQNVANANTPGYKTADLKPFDAALQSASLQLASTSAGHFVLEKSQADAVPEAGNAENPDVYFSGNDVSQEEEMGKAGAISRAYALNISVVKALNGMLVLAAKG
jgi:flagellar basal-body rod protein FlgB